MSDVECLALSDSSASAKDDSDDDLAPLLSRTQPFVSRTQQSKLSQHSPTTRARPLFSSTQPSTSRVGPRKSEPGPIRRPELASNGLQGSDTKIKRRHSDVMDGKAKESTSRTEPAVEVIDLLDSSDSDSPQAQKASAVGSRAHKQASKHVVREEYSRDSVCHL